MTIPLRPSLVPPPPHTHMHTLDVSESFLQGGCVQLCSNCRHDLGKDYAMTVNKSLQAVLLDLFRPGYNGGRSHYTH